MFRTVAALATLAAAGPAAAGPLLIAPTTIQFAPGRHSAVIELTNESADPVTLQFRAFEWSQPDGRDRLTPATDLIVSPPIVRLAPHAKQVFRVLDTGATGATERSYRLKLNELPTAQTAMVGVTVEFSLPVFLTPPGAASGLVVAADGGSLHVANTGTRHLRLGKLALRDAGGGEHEVAGAEGTYVLAGATRSLAGAPVRGMVPVRITGLADDGPVNLPLAKLAAR